MWLFVLSTWDRGKRGSQRLLPRKRFGNRGFPPHIRAFSKFKSVAETRGKKFWNILRKFVVTTKIFLVSGFCFQVSHQFSKQLCLRTENKREQKRPVQKGNKKRDENRFGVGVVPNYSAGLGMGQFLRRGLLLERVKNEAFFLLQQPPSIKKGKEGGIEKFETIHPHPFPKCANLCLLS